MPMMLARRRLKPKSASYYREQARDYGRRQRAAARSRNLRSGGFLGKELKYKDAFYDAALIVGIPDSEADPLTLLCINATAQGSGESERDGRRQFTKSVHVAGTIQWTAQDTTTIGLSPFVVILLVLDRQTNGTQLSTEDVLVHPANSDHDAMAFNNLEHGHRFKVLRRIVVKMPASSSFWDGDSGHRQGHDQPFKLNYYWKKPLQTTYTAATAAIGSIVDNSIHVIAIQGQNAGGSLGVMRYMSRCRFTSG